MECMEFNKKAIIISIISVVIAILLIILGMFGAKYYKVWALEMDGKALLMKASQEKQILIETAKAEKEAAMERAEAIKIIGEASQKYPEYRTQEFIGAFGDALKDGKINQIIYVPTEANIPILEVGKR